MDALILALNTLLRLQATRTSLAQVQKAIIFLHQTPVGIVLFQNEIKFAGNDFQRVEGNKL